MELAYAFLADAADIGRTGKISVVGGDFETIFVQQIPAVHPQLTMVARLTVMPEECERTHTFNIELESPNGATVPGFESEFVPHIVPGHEKRPVRFFLVGNLPLVAFIMAGNHVFHVYVDSVELGKISFQVEQISASPESGM